MSTSHSVDATESSANYFKNYPLVNREMFSLLNPLRIAERVIGIFYVWIQFLIVAVFKPVRIFENSRLTLNISQKPPITAKPEKPNGRIAVVGAGLTGVSSAAYVYFAFIHVLRTVLKQQKSRSRTWFRCSHIRSR
jgi:hypothetical protein